MFRTPSLALLTGALLASASIANAQSSLACFLGGTSSRYGNGARIDGDVGTNQAGGLLQLGRRSIVATGGSARGDTVRLGNGSQVPIAAFNTLQAPKATVGTEQTPVTLPLVDDFCPVPAFACGGESVKVRKNGSQQLAPGTYGDVLLQNGSTLELVAGTYEFCSLRGGRKAEVIVAGGAAAILNIQGELRLENGSTLGANGGGTLPVVNVGGGRAKLGSKSRVAAQLSAPGATLLLGGGTRWTGSFCAATVSGGSNVSLDCEAPAPPTTTTTTAPTTTSSTTTTAPPTTSTTAAPTTSTTAPTTTSTTTTAPPTTSTTTAPTTSTTTTTAPTTTSTTTTAPPTTSTTTAPTTSTTTTTAPTTSTTTTTTAPPTTSTTTTTTAPPTTSTTTTTTAPPTTSTTTTTTPTTTTTTTTVLTQFVCGTAARFEVTVGVNYPVGVVNLAGMALELNYVPPVSIPTSGVTSTVNARVTRLFTLAPGTFQFVVSDNDTGPPTGDDQLRAAMTVQTGIPIGPLERVSFDCANGEVVQAANFTCGFSGLADSAGTLLPPEVAAQVTCSLAFSVP